MCAILETEATGTLIRWTEDATRRYEASFVEAWPHELYTAVRAYLESRNPVGCLKEMRTPSGESYEFFFAFKGIKTYGKIMLRKGDQQVVIFSAHLPLRDKLDCE